MVNFSDVIQATGFAVASLEIVDCRLKNWASATADQDLCVLVQIETQAALDKIEEVAAVESIDGLREWTSEAGLSNQCVELLMNISGIAHHFTYGRCLLFMSDRNLQSLLGVLAGVGSLMFTDVCS